jgi:hypothetical protein
MTAHNGAAGWPDHSHCPWLSRRLRSLSRNSVTTLTMGGSKHAHTPGIANGQRSKLRIETACSLASLRSSRKFSPMTSFIATNSRLGEDFCTIG